MACVRRHVFSLCATGMFLVYPSSSRSVFRMLNLELCETFAVTSGDELLPLSYPSYFSLDYSSEWGVRMCSV